MRHKWMFLLLPFGALSLAPVFAAQPDISVEPEALKHYSYCISEAKDRNSVFFLERQILYRCHGDIAISYFNYLGHHRVEDQLVEEVSGVFFYRTINGVGRCWNKIADAAQIPVSAFGCDIYVEI